MNEELQDLRTEGRMPHEEHDRRMQAARARAQWELGYPEWANVILAAYMDPDGDTRRLKADKAQT